MLPASIQPFRPRRGLALGHLQTIAAVLLPRRQHPPAPVTELVDVPLPVEMQAMSKAVALDRRLPSRVLCHCHWQASPGATTVVLVHGLEGSSHSQYMVGNAAGLWRAGANVVRMNMRNCGSTDALSPALYHSGMSGDVRAVLQWCVQRGHTRVVLAGYSMGGNLVLKAAGELGAAEPALLGVFAVSPAMNLAESADALHLVQNRLYERRFLRDLEARFRRKVRLFPATYRISALEKVRSIRSFDEYVTAPHCGFAGADDYYARAGAASVLAHIAVPTLIVHSTDDPFIRVTAETRQTLRLNPCTTLLEPSRGGHCAFLEDADAASGYDGYWAEEALLAFVREASTAGAREAMPPC